MFNRNPFAKKRKKKVYCERMYIGYVVDANNFGILCDITDGPCLGYEEAARSIDASTDVDETYRPEGHWTQQKTWRISLTAINNCPANNKRFHTIPKSDEWDELVEPELTKAEKEFFRS